MVDLIEYLNGLKSINYVILVAKTDRENKEVIDEWRYIATVFKQLIEDGRFCVVLTHSRTIEEE